MEANEQIMVAIVKFIISMLSIAFMSQYADSLGDLMLPPEEREQREQGGAALRELQERLGLDASTHFSSHEILVAGGLVTPGGGGFGEIGGHTRVKEELMLHVVVPLRYHDLFFSDARLQPPAGVLFTGPPGTGKTMLARALAQECKVPFLAVKTDLVEQKYFGESEKVIKAIFSFASKIAPCVVFIDEIDGLMRDRSDFEQAATYSIKTQLLQEIDRLEYEKKPIVLIAATNNVASLDKALYRRLPRAYTIEKPDAEARREIFRKCIEDEPQTRQLRKYEKWIVEQTAGFSGADLKNMYRSAKALRNEAFTRVLAERGEVTSSPGTITKAHLTAAIARTKASSFLA